MWVVTSSDVPRAQARVKQGDPMAAEYLLDVLGDKPVLSLPTQRRAPQRAHINALTDDAAAPRSSATVLLSHSKSDSDVTHLQRRRQARQPTSRDKTGALPGEMRRRLATVLAREFSKKVLYKT